MLQLPKFMELVGLGYTSWFIYRYLLFKVRGVTALTHMMKESPYLCIDCCTCAASSSMDSLS